jgi:hypothetical protein
MTAVSVGQCHLRDALSDAEVLASWTVSPEAFLPVMEQMPAMRSAKRSGQGLLSTYVRGGRARSYAPSPKEDAMRLRNWLARCLVLVEHFVSPL